MPCDRERALFFHLNLLHVLNVDSLNKTIGVNCPNQTENAANDDGPCRSGEVKRRLTILGNSRLRENSKLLHFIF